MHEGREENEKPFLVLIWRTLAVLPEPHVIYYLLEPTCNLTAVDPHERNIGPDKDRLFT